ncbi:MAG: 4-alpha-glucanotransferase [Chloroflexi bacterium]|nr:MAG: 4-alpha-glucanotransferase [Chloroflexota bacterium]
MHATAPERSTATDRHPPPRYSGVLAHPTSFPGGHGIGDLGAGTTAFMEWLAEARQTRWQVLPLGPTGFGDSPYQSFSAFAGNPLLVSLDSLVEDGLLGPHDLEGAQFPVEHVDFGAVIPWKLERLRRAAARLRSGAAPALYDALRVWSDEHAAWLDDYALFMALKAAHGGASWLEWEPALRLREPQALAAARERLADEIDAQRFMQFAFSRQWRIVRERANELGLQIIGDVPIFVALDSADVWANRALFQLDADGHPTAVAGVPPDYFSATGQLWGNPLYDWDALAADGYRWWIARLRAVFELVDIARVDHFRGFEAYWSVPAGERTAVNGAWQPGPGVGVFDAITAALPRSEIIAEDLGVITPAVDALRRELGFPGMAVLQFAFGSGPENLYLPHNLEHRTVIYTGTHDNDTTLGWWATLDDATRQHVTTYLRSDGSDIAWDLLYAAWSSVAETAIAPLQDILRLGGEARMNLPGRAWGNWAWRMHPNALQPDLAAALADMTGLYGR